MRVGFIGLGNMGLHMANNLLAKGADLTVNNRSQGKVDEIASRGAKRATTAGALTDETDIVLACLPDIAISRKILLGPDGVMEHARAGQIIVDHGTVSISTSRDCAEAAEQQGALFLDAPISGGPLGARDGTLAIMVGGDRDAFQRAKPVFEKMGANVRHMGPSGAGTAMKLINQLLVSVNVCAAAEAFQLASAASLDVAAAAEVLDASWGQSRMVGRSAPITAARDFENSAAPIRNLVKDIGIIADLGEDLGIALPLSLAARELILETERFDPNYDIAGTIRALEERARR